MTMTMHALPRTESVRDMLLDMLGRDVGVVPADPWAPTPRDPGAVAVYTDDRSTLRALAACNLPLAAYLGASIALIPPHTAHRCIEDRSLTESITENLHEVLTIMSALFTMPGRPHLKLSGVQAPGELPAADVSVRLRAFGRRMDLTVDVGGYGEGRLSVVVV